MSRAERLKNTMIALFVRRIRIFGKKVVVEERNDAVPEMTCACKLLVASSTSARIRK
jgi:hypothetical protein